MEMAATHKTISIELLPPPEHVQHISILYKFIMDWKYLEENHNDPSDWCWTLKSGFYHPTFTDESVTPDNLLKFVRCNCKFQQNIHEWQSDPANPMAYIVWLLVVIAVVLDAWTNHPNKSGKKSNYNMWI